MVVGSERDSGKGAPGGGGGREGERLQSPVTSSLDFSCPGHTSLGFRIRCWRWLPVEFRVGVDLFCEEGLAATFGRCWHRTASPSEFGKSYDICKTWHPFVVGVCD